MVMVVEKLLAKEDTMTKLTATGYSRPNKAVQWLILTRWGCKFYEELAKMLSVAVHVKGGGDFGNFLAKIEAWWKEKEENISRVWP